jgi:hypothetical protein
MVERVGAGDAIFLVDEQSSRPRHCAERMNRSLRVSMKGYGAGAVLRRK